MWSPYQRNGAPHAGLPLTGIRHESGKSYTGRDTTEEQRDQEQDDARRIAPPAVGRDLLSILLGRRHAEIIAGAAFGQHQGDSQPDAAAPDERNASADHFRTARPGFDTGRKSFERRRRTQHLHLSDADAPASAHTGTDPSYADAMANPGVFAQSGRRDSADGRFHFDGLRPKDAAGRARLC